MKHLTFSCLIVFLLSCNAEIKENNLGEVAQIMEEVSKRTDTKLTYKMVLTKIEDEPFVITIHDPIKYDRKVGHVVLEAFEALESSGRHFDRYIVKDNSNLSLGEMSTNTLTEVSKFKEITDTIVELIDAKRYEDIYPSLDSAQFTPDDIATIKDRHIQLGDNGHSSFVGFDLEEHEGIVYCWLDYRMDNKYLARFLVNASNPNYKIMSIQFVAP